MRIEEIDGAKLVKNLAQNMEEMFRKKAEATRVSLHYLQALFNLEKQCIRKHSNAHSAWI